MQENFMNRKFARDRRLWAIGVFALAALVGLPIASLAWQSGAPLLASVEPSYLQLRHWRMVGPSRGGRVTTVAGDPVHKLVFYFGATGGGIWKTEDGGGRVGRGCAVESEHRLRRHGRGVRSRQRILRRRRVQVHRCRQDLDERR